MKWFGSHVCSGSQSAVQDTQWSEEESEGVTRWLMRTNNNSRVTSSQALFPKSVFFFPSSGLNKRFNPVMHVSTKMGWYLKAIFKSLKLQYHLLTTKRRTPKPRPEFLDYWHFEIRHHIFEMDERRTKRHLINPLNVIKQTRYKYIF